MNDDKAKAYKKNYSIIFSSFYLVQGLHNGIHKVDEELMDLKLGLGETEVIHNSIKIKCQCMMEDKKAKRIAESFNLDVRKIPISMLEAYQNKIIDNLEFENYLIKWVKFASPSYEEVYFVKKIKELLE